MNIRFPGLKIKSADKTITALEITSSHIKVAQSKLTPRGALINKLFASRITSNNPDDIAKSLKELLSVAKINTDNLILAIPRQLLTVRIVKLPSLDNKEIEKMVELQLTKQFPCPREDIVADYLIVEKSPSGYSQVLLVICQKEIINRYLNILSLNGLNPQRIALSSEGICRWYRDSKPVLFLDIDKQNTDICFCRKEGLLFSRSVSFGVDDLNNLKTDNLIEELHKTFSHLQREQINFEIEKILITASAEGAHLLAEKLKIEFSKVVELVNPLREVSFEKDLIAPLIFNEGGASSASILGLVLRPAKDEINLLPAEVKKEEESKSKIKDLSFFGILLVCCLVLTAAIMGTKIYKNQSFLKKLDQILKEEGPKAKRIEDSLKKLTLARERLNPSGSSIDVIYELYNIIPEGITLSIFSFEDNQFITLQGVANQMSDVFNFQGILEKAPYFKSVEVKYASKRRVRQTEVTDFRITCAVDIEKIRER